MTRKYIVIFTVLVAIMSSVQAIEYTLIDNFNDASLDTSLWTAEVTPLLTGWSGTASITESGGSVNLIASDSSDINKQVRLKLISVQENNTDLRNRVFNTSRFVVSNGGSCSDCNAYGAIKISDGDVNATVLQQTKPNSIDVSDLLIFVDSIRGEAVYSSDNFMTNTTVNISALNTSLPWFIMVEGGAYLDESGSVSTQTNLYDAYWGYAYDNFAVSLKDVETGAYIQKYNVSINNTIYQVDDYIAITDIPKTSGSLVDIEFHKHMYANITYSNVNASSSDFLGNISPAIPFYAKDFYTGGILQNFTVQIDGNTYNTGNGVIYPNYPIYPFSLISFNVSSVENGGYTVNTTSVLNTSQLLVNASLWQSYINFTIKTNNTGLFVSNFTINFTDVDDASNSYQASTNNGSVVFRNVSLGNYTATSITTGNQDGNTTIDVYYLSRISYTFNLYLSNSFVITIYDENTQDIVDFTNFTVEVIGDLAAYNFTTANGTITQEFVIPDDYEVRYYSTNNDDYKLRSQFFTLTNGTYQQLSVYALNESDDTKTYARITFIVYNEDLEPVENEKITVSRYYISQNAYLPAWERLTDVQGEATGDFESIDAFYKYTVTHTDGSVLYQSGAKQFVADDVIPIYVVISSQDVVNEDAFRDIPVSLTVTNTSNTTGYVTFTFSSSSVVQACLLLEDTRLIAPQSDEQCVSTTSGTIILNYDSENTTRTYKATALLSTNVYDNLRAIDTVTFTVNYSDAPNTQSWKSLAVFFSLIIIIGIVIWGASYPMSGSIALTIVVIILALPQIAIFNIPLAATSWVLGIVVLNLQRYKRQ